MYPRILAAERLLQLLRAPRSLKPLELQGSQLRAESGELYPLVEGIPVLIDNQTSAFAVEDFLVAAPPSQTGVSALRTLIERLLPSPSHNLTARRNYERLGKLLASRLGEQRVLVVGGSTLGTGMDALLSAGTFEVIETDVAFGPRTDVICDGHALPFEDGVFDAVVCQAVLEHVADPPQVVSEIWRVLAPEGLVYSEIPFMQQVHEGAYDFTRYTLTGHRRLFRHFEVIDCGANGGPGMSLAWSIVYFARAAGSRWSTLQDFLAALARLLSFWLKYFDRALLKLPGGIEGASGTYFLGHKSEGVLSDRVLIHELTGEQGGHLVWRG